MNIRWVWSFLALLFILSGAGGWDAGVQQPPETKHSGKFARPSAGWVHNAVVYEVYLRSFSKKGTFHGLEERLEELKDMGVTVIWLMPIHPIGKEKRKGTLGSPYS
ncbi:MAG TPA: alpha-amylase, partial [Bacteroidota bacterium]